MKKWEKVKKILKYLAYAAIVGMMFYILFVDKEMLREKYLQIHWISPNASAKPVIYLYPESETEVTVTLDLDGEFTSTWPPYEDGWTVTALPDSTLYDADGEEYYCLFWEGDLNYDCDFSEGFCVPGEETGEFLRDVLSEMGLTPREYNEMILYWLPQMENNPYNIISFQQENYDSAAKLQISPEPDNVLRVMMAWTPSEEYVDIPEQTFEPFEREGFVAVEWGGRVP